MDDPTPHPDPSGETRDGTPRWVKIFGIIALVIALLFVILMMTRGARGHGPGRHKMFGDAISGVARSWC